MGRSPFGDVTSNDILELTFRDSFRIDDAGVLLQRENVVVTATRLCHPLPFRERPLRRGGRRECRCEASGFSFARCIYGRGARLAVFFQWQRQGEEQLVSAIDAQQAIPTDDSSTPARFFPRSPGPIKTLGLRRRLIYLQCHIL